MADISITDQVNLTTSVEVRDDSPLALANLKKLRFTSLPIVGDFGKPIDCFPLSEAVVGVDLSTPAHLGFSVGISAVFSICTPPQETLFDADEFAPALAIKANECWAGLSLETSLQESLKASTAGIGVAVMAGTQVAFGTFVHFPGTGAAIPDLRHGLATVLENFYVADTPQKLRAIPVATAYTSEAGGILSLGACYSAPLQVNPLATLGLPFNLAIGIAPDVEAAVKGSISLSGSFVVRSYRSSDTKLIIGVYRKKKTTLKASLCASAGVGIDIEKTDILAKVLDAVFPPADLKGLHLDDAQASDLNKGLQECADQSISIAINACCSTSEMDEAAVIYELDLSRGDVAETDSALAKALRGDWSALETLSNARPLRHIVRALQERNHKLTINLLGLYNAGSISNYLQSTTVLQDEHGQISVVDKAAAKDMSFGTTPYAAKSDKLRSALAQAFVATITYAACAGKIGMQSFTVHQSFLEYRAQANSSDLTRNVLLARSIGLPLNSAWDTILKSSAVFSYCKFYLDARYDSHSVMRLFYKDVDKLIPHSASELDKLGRDAKIALLDPLAANSLQRRMALSNDEIWNAMNTSGDVATFRQIPGIAKLDRTAVAAISADWVDIRWWSDALQRLTPRLTAVLDAIEKSRSPDPTSDLAFMAVRKNLEHALAALTSKTQSAFGDGWGLAVMYRLAMSTAGPAPFMQMDIGWNRQFEHYETGTQIAVGQTSGT